MYNSGSEVSEQKPLSQFPSLDNVKSIHIQNGYSGVLYPKKTLDTAETYLEDIGVDKGILEYVKALIPKTLKALLKFVVKAGAVAVTAVLIILITSSIATAFCAYSDLCSLKFPGLEWRNEALEESMRSFLTPEKMSFLGSFIHNAISKYDNLNKKKSKSLKH